MTEAAAHKFIARCGRVFIPLWAQSEGEALQAMNASCGVLLGGGLFVCFISMIGISTFAPPSSLLWRAVNACAILLTAVSLILLWRFRQARRALDRAVYRKS